MRFKGFIAAVLSLMMITSAISVRAFAEEKQVLPVSVDRNVSAKEKADTDKVDSDNKKVVSYFNIINDYEKKYGKMTMSQLDKNYYMDGVFLLELVDFNNDGIKELVIGYENDPKYSESEYIFDYSVDVYSCDKSGKAFQAFSGKAMNADPFYTGGGNNLIRYAYKDDKYYLIQGKVLMNDEEYNLLQFDGKKFSTEKKFVRTEKGCTIDGKKVSDDDFTEQFNEYTSSYYNGNAAYYCTQIYRYPRAMYDNTLAVKKSFGIDSELADIVDFGKTSDGLSWKLHKTGMLFISGKGSMKKYSSVSDTPWYKNKNSITSVEIEKGVTSVSQYAFKGYKLHHIYFADTVKTIGKQAFADVKWLDGENYKIYFDGDVPTIADDSFQNIEETMGWYYPYYGEYNEKNNPWLEHTNWTSNITVWDYAHAIFSYSLNNYHKDFYHTKTVDEAYLNAYAEFLKKNQTTYKDSTFMLGFVNDDDIPELIICTNTSRVGNVGYYTYYNGKVVNTANMGSYGLSAYIPKGNVMAGSDMHMGIGYGVYYKMKEDGTGVKLLSYSEDTSGSGGYTINEKSVSKTEYDKALKPYANNDKFVEAAYSDGFKVDSTNIQRLAKTPSAVINPNDELIKAYYNK